MTAVERDKLIILEEQMKTLQAGHEEISADVKAIRSTLDNLAGGKQALLWITGIAVAIAGVVVGFIHRNVK